MRLRAGLPAVLLALLLLVPGCVRVDVPAGTDDVSDAPAGEATLTPPDGGTDLEVPLEIVEGPDEAILALVPVMIGDAGPYAFALDTGASNSVLDEAIAEELGLEQVGEERGVAGVTGEIEAVQVQIDDWRTGDVDLGARPVIVLDLLGPTAGAGIEGLLGSDVLSAFGAITVDYDAGVLRLRPRAG